MKTLLKFSLALAAAATLTLVACNRTDDDPANDNLTIASEDAAQLESIHESSDNEIDESLAPYGKTSGGSTCATVSATQPAGTYPNVITLDFGTGCVGTDGRTRKGKIIVTLSAAFSQTNATRTMTFDNFYVNDVKVEGTREVKNLGADAAGCRTVGITVTNGKLTFADGTTRTWNSSRTRTQIAGCATDDRADDIWKITGSATGTTRNGNAFTATISSPLIKSVSCRWIETGIITINVGNRSRTLDFGDGTCDNAAVVTLSTGKTRNITLR